MACFLPRTHLRLVGRLSLLLALGAGLLGCGPARPAASSSAAAVLFGETSRIRGFDPVKAGDFATALAVGRIYEGLLQYAYRERPYRLEPLLATALPELAADGLTYTFRVRPGIYFQDDPCFRASGGRGRELTAEDFVYSILRVADQKNASTGYWAFQGRIVGLDEFRAASGLARPTDYSQRVSGLRALDRYTLSITLTQPYPQLLWVLTMPYAAAVPHEAVDFYGREFVNHPVGTGPFILQSWRPNYRLEYARNPQWAARGRAEFDPLTAEPLPRLDGLVEYVIADDTTKWMMFLEGHLDRLGAIARDNWEAVLTPDRRLRQDLTARGIRLSAHPTLEIYYIGFNMDDPLVGTNRLLRQALTCAFNTQSWLAFYNQRVLRPRGPIPPALMRAAEGPERFPFDLERARRLLAQAGYAQGLDPRTGRRLQLTLDLAAADSAEVRQSTELIVDFMDKIGVIIRPCYNNKPAFFDKIERRQAQMFRLSWSADYPDAQNFLQLFYSANASPGPNRTNYSNPEFDALYERIRGMADTPERTALYAQMAAIVVEDSPWIFTHSPLVYGLQQAWLQPIQPHDFPFGMDKYYEVDGAARRRALKEWGS